MEYRPPQPDARRKNPPAPPGDLDLQLSFRFCHGYQGREVLVVVVLRGFGVADIPEEAGGDLLLPQILLDAQAAPQVVVPGMVGTAKFIAGAEFFGVFHMGPPEVVLGRS